MVHRRHHLALVGLILLAVGTGPVWSQPAEIDPELRSALMNAVERSDSFEDRFEAEVWLSDFSNRLARYVDDADRRLEILRLIHAESRAAEVPPELVLAVIEVESRFDHFAISPAGALGLMQVMPFWVREIGRPEDNLLDPQTNLRYGCTILKHYLTRERGDLVRALGRYNGRILDNPYQGLVLDALSRRWFRR